MPITIATWSKAGFMYKGGASEASSLLVAIYNEYYNYSNIIITIYIAFIATCNVHVVAV